MTDRLDSTDFLPYGCHDITEADIECVVDVLKNQNITQGTIVPEFEASISRYVKSRYCLVTTNATSSLHLACLALNVSKGDLVWTSPTTFVASANCARYCGAEVDFVDIDLTTGLMCLDKLEAKLVLASKNSSLPDVVIPVHLAGASVDMRRLHQLSLRFNFSIIEDASHAIGGSFEDSKVGSCKFSDISVFSFHPVKIITTGEGGAITTNRKDLYQKMLSLRSHGITKEVHEFDYQKPGNWYYEQQLLGFNYRLTDIQAALGLSQLRRLDDIIIERQKLRQNYINLLSDVPVRYNQVPDNVASSNHLFIIQLIGSMERSLAHVFDQMRHFNIGVQQHYVPCHLHPYYRNLGFEVGDFPVAEKYSEISMSVPIYPGLTINDQNRVVHTLMDIVNN